MSTRCFAPPCTPQITLLQMSKWQDPELLIVIVAAIKLQPRTSALDSDRFSTAEWSSSLKVLFKYGRRGAHLHVNVSRHFISLAPRAMWRSFIFLNRVQGLHSCSRCDCYKLYDCSTMSINVKQRDELTCDGYTKTERLCCTVNHCRSEDF